MRHLRYTDSLCLFCSHVLSAQRAPSPLWAPHRWAIISGARFRQHAAHAGRPPGRASRIPPPHKARNPRKGNLGKRLHPRELDVLLEKLESHLQDAPIIPHLEKDGYTFASVFADFKAAIAKSRVAAWSAEDRRLWEELQEAYMTGSHAGLETKLRYAFYGYVSGLRFTETDVQNQKAVADLRYPAEWFPAARTRWRTVHLHVGPTNSGKTFHALRSLEAARSGTYAGPLRLLAYEVYTRLNSSGRRCALVTGDERKAPPDNNPGYDICAATVEMLDLNSDTEVAVIDEIQMLGSEERGWAWTQALLGIRAREVHLCGEARAIPIINSLCAMMGEKPIIHRYERLSPLEVDSRSLDGDMGNLRKGDCIVSFSIMNIHALRRRIEKATGRKVATVYGSLPPETRAQQARLFNEPDNDYDFLVASDAIGMGLNLNIKRIIFETADKFDGQKRVTLPLSDIKQIAGRAGRYKAARLDDAEPEEQLSTVKGENEADVNLVEESNVTRPEDSYIPSYKPVAYNSPYEKAIRAIDPNASSENPPRPPPNDSSNTGRVTTLHKVDYPIVSKAMNRTPPPIRTAGIHFPSNVLNRFAQFFPPGTPFGYILLRMSELCQVSAPFHLCGLREHLYIADLIEPVRGLSITDRITFTYAPISGSASDLWNSVVPAYARCVESQSGGALYDIAEVPLEILDEPIVLNRDFLQKLEKLHKALILYLWLSFRFTGIFSTRLLAQEVKRRIEDRIEIVLEGLTSQRGIQEENLANERKRAERMAKWVESAEFENEATPAADSQPDQVVAGDEGPSEGQAEAPALEDFVATETFDNQRRVPDEPAPEHATTSAPSASRDAVDEPATRLG